MSTRSPVLPTSLHRLLTHRRVLLLQGPMGPFFGRLAAFLEQQGQAVTKVNFNGGDAWFHPRGALAFRGTPEQWPGWLAEVLRSRRIEAIALFGQMRSIHVAATKVANDRGVPCFVFEEGYFRPDYVTLEEGGVNANSSLPREPSAYRQVPEAPAMSPQPTGQRFSKMAWLATQYSVATWVGHPWFRHHRYHRDINPIVEAARWLRGGWRKHRYAWQERDVLAQLCAPGRSKQWFLLPLQVANDSQIVHHSHFQDMHEVIAETVASFAAHAPTDSWLVIKHHPMDRCHTDYAKYIRTLRRQHGLQGRLLYVHDLHLPTLLKHCRGVVTVNSTTGLQAMHHRVPVRTLAECFYALPGLVNLQPLERFWKDPRPVNHGLYRRFRDHAVRATQLNASFYAEAPALAIAPRSAGRALKAFPEQALKGE